MRSLRKYVYTYVHTYITLHYITLHYITLHYITYITLHYITLHYITLHYITYIHTHTYICIYIYIHIGHHIVSPLGTTYPSSETPERPPSDRHRETPHATPVPRPSSRLQRDLNRLGTQQEIGDHWSSPNYLKTMLVFVASNRLNRQ